MVHCPGSQNPADFLGGCLVEGDAEFEARARKIKRRALVASILLQLVFLAALVLFPLLGKSEGIAAYSVTPSVPYHRGSVTEHQQRSQQRPAGPRTVCTDCFRQIPATIAIIDRRIVENSDPEPFIPGTPTGSDVIGSLVSSDRPKEPPPPDTHAASQPVRRKVSAGVQAARLVRRVEPKYPPLAIQLHREGRVELHAIIATDGQVKSLEVVSGDPLLLKSALDAVGQWRYQATLLSGEPIEVETYISVVYTLNR